MSAATNPEPALPAEAARLLAAIQARGVVTSTLRDAAHEACHALQWGVKKRWTRDNIHARKPKPHRIFGDIGVHDEIVARAVEQLVCRQLGVDCGTVERWAMTCWMEMLKNERISLPTGDWLANQINEAMGSVTARRLADRVVALGGTSETETARRSASHSKAFAAVVAGTKKKARGKR